MRKKKKALEYYWNNVRNYIPQCCHKEQFAETFITVHKA